MKKKRQLIEVLYSPNQVSSHYQISDEKIDFQLKGFCTDAPPVKFTPVEEIDLTVALTFICNAIQTDVPFNETVKQALCGLERDPLETCLKLRVAVERCPVECVSTVTVETLRWLKMFRRNAEDDTITCNWNYSLTARGRSLKNLSPSKLYQVSILNCKRHVVSECDLPQACYWPKGSQLMIEDLYFPQDLSDFRLQLDFCCHHKSSAADVHLLLRDFCLVSFIGIASLADFAQSYPTFDCCTLINIKCCDKCRHVVASAVRYLLNTVRYFHVFLPFDGSLTIISYHDYVRFKDSLSISIWDLLESDVPDILFYNSDSSYTRKTHTCDEYFIYIRIEPEWQSLSHKPRHPKTSSHRDSSRAGWSTGHGSHSHLLPKS
eukprot:scpid85512/ scgid28852/ 